MFAGTLAHTKTHTHRCVPAGEYRHPFFQKNGTDRKRFQSDVPNGEKYSLTSDGGNWAIWWRRTPPQYRTNTKEGKKKKWRKLFQCHAVLNVFQKLVVPKFHTFFLFLLYFLFLFYHCFLWPLSMTMEKRIQNINDHAKEVLPLKKKSTAASIVPVLFSNEWFCLKLTQGSGRTLDTWAFQNCFYFCFFLKQ